MPENFERNFRPNPPEPPEPKPEQPDESKSPETELSPEAIETIMEKVQDIDRKGTAYTSVRNPQKMGEILPILRSTLEQGIWPRGHENSLSEGDAERAERWKNIHRKLKRPMWKDWNYFQIVGRADITSAYAWKPQGLPEVNYNTGGDFIMLFDSSFLSEFEYGRMGNYEVIVEERKKKVYPDDSKVSHGEFIADGITFSQWKFQKLLKEGEPILPQPVITLGFKTKARIAPRRFRGLVIPDHYLAPQSSNPELVAAVSRVMIETSHARNKDYLLPVYSMAGSLLWPKKMSYEEVKRFVSERETKSKPSKTDPKQPQP